MKNGFFPSMLGTLLLGASFVSVASGPYTVVTEPGSTLPDTVIAGGESDAFYRITNQTNSVLANSFVKHLPPNVEQVVGDPNYCDATFSLDKNGTSGDNCTLKLRVTGAVDDVDPNPEHQLYVCADQYNCSRAEDLLDVAVITALVSGQYCDDAQECSVKAPAEGFKPLLAQRQDNTWDYVTPAGNLPESYLDYGVFSSVSCSENFCMTAGIFLSDEIISDGFDSFNAEKPLLAMSANGAGNWAYSQYFADDYLFGHINAVSCGDNVCVGAGTGCSEEDLEHDNCNSNFSPASTDQRIFNALPDNPILVYSSDGDDWETFDVVDLIEEVIITNSNQEEFEIFYVAEGELYASGCSDTSCAVGGGYSAALCYTGGCFDPTTIPLLLTSDTDGDNWRAIYPSNTEELGVYQGEFLATTCSSDYCMAGGTGFYGVLLAVQDGNTDWVYAEAFMNDINDDEGGQINSVNCSGTLCVAVGGDNDEDSLDAPFLVLSHDGFEYNWTYLALEDDTPDGGNTIVPVNDPPTYYVDLGALYSVSCDNNVCAAAGEYFPDFKQEKNTSQPLLLHTTDYGQNWYFIKDLPADFISGKFTSVSCSAGICTAVGEYFNNQDVVKPLLAESINGGAWTFNGKLPTDFVNQGFFSGTNAPGSGNASASSFVFAKNRHIF